MSDFDRFVDALIDHMEDINQLPRGFLRENSPLDPKNTYSYFAAKLMLEHEQAVREFVAENHKKLMDDFLKSVGEEEV